MNPKELRLGNYCQDKLTGAILQVIRLSDGEELHCNFKVIDRSKYPLPEGWKAEYIPLTPEILEKCGFIDRRITINEQDIKIYLDDETFCLWGRDGCTMGHAFDGDIKYLHQLQNLYFALTGEELNIQL